MEWRRPYVGQRDTPERVEETPRTAPLSNSVQQEQLTNLQQEDTTPTLDLVGPPDLLVGEIDPVVDGEAIDTSCPVPEGTMGVFDVPKGETCHITSANFLTCVGLVLECDHGKGKRIGFVHINELESGSRASDIARLITETGLKGGKVEARVFSRTGTRPEEAQEIIDTLLGILKDNGVAVVGVMPETHNERSKKDDNLPTASLVSVSETGEVSVSTSNDPSVHDRIDDRQDDFLEQSSWHQAYQLEGEALTGPLRALMRRLEEETDPKEKEALEKEAGALYQELDDLGKAPYPQLWNPEGGEHHGNTWSG